MNFKYNGEKIRALREAEDWTRPHLARWAGVDTETIYRLENHKTKKTNARTLEDISRALGVPVESISEDYYPPIPPFLATVGYNRDALINARQDRGWSVQELAEKSGVSFQQIYSLEAGRSKKSKPSTIHYLAAVLGVKPRDLAPALGYAPGRHERETYADHGMYFGYPAEVRS